MSNEAKKFIKNVIDNKMFDAKQNFNQLMNEKVALELKQTRKDIAKTFLKNPL